MSNLNNNLPSFLGCNIKCIKPSINHNDNKTKIVVSTCYFMASNFSITDKSFTYIDGLIENIESFQMKIDRFTNKPERWIYRVYIDETIMNLKNLMDNILSKDTPFITKNNLSNSNIEKIEINIKKNYNELLYLYNLLIKYIEHIKKNVSNPKYNQIEIYTYSNDEIKYKLVSNPSFKISGHIATFGTLMRYHPLTDPNVAVVIMRNSSTNLSPLDIIIQNYWINNTGYKYMEFKIYKYVILYFSILRQSI